MYSVSGISLYNSSTKVQSDPIPSHFWVHCTYIYNIGILMNSGSETYIRNYLFFQWNRDNLINWIILNWIDRLFLLFVLFSRDTFTCIGTNVTFARDMAAKYSVFKQGRIFKYRVDHFLLYHGTSVEMVASENQKPSPKSPLPTTN